MACAPFDALQLTRMASGHACLDLSERVTWDCFPELASAVLSRIGGRVIDRADSVGVRVWNVEVGGCVLRLVFDDYPVMASLESRDERGDRVLEAAYHALKDAANA